MDEIKKKYYDEDGEEITEELVSVKDLQAKDTELAELKDKYSKLEDKDLNFKKLRDMSEEEKSKYSTEKMELKQQIDSLEDKIENITKTTTESKESELGEYKDELLSKLSGGDEELKKKIEFEYKRFGDRPVTKKQVDDLIKDSYHLATKDISGTNPVLNAAAHYGKDNIKQDKENFANTEKGKEMARALGMGFIKAEDEKKKKEEED